MGGHAASYAFLEYHLIIKFTVVTVIQPQSLDTYDVTCTIYHCAKYNMEK